MSEPIPLDIKQATVDLSKINKVFPGALSKMREAMNEGLIHGSSGYIGGLGYMVHTDPSYNPDDGTALGCGCLIAHANKWTGYSSLSQTRGAAFDSDPTIQRNFEEAIWHVVPGDTPENNEVLAQIASIIDHIIGPADGP